MLLCYFAGGTWEEHQHQLPVPSPGLGTNHAENPGGLVQSNSLRIYTPRPGYKLMPACWLLHVGCPMPCPAQPCSGDKVKNATTSSMEGRLKKKKYQYKDTRRIGLHVYRD